MERTSSKDVSIGRHGSPLHTATTKLQLKYRTTVAQNNRNLVDGSLTTTELKKPHPSKLSQHTGAVSEIPSTWLTLFDPPWRSPETPPNLLACQAAFSYEWSWLKLHNFLNPLKQAAAGLSEFQASN